MSSALGMAAFVILAIGLGWLAMRRLTRRGSAEYRRQAERLELISGLSLQEAEARALRSLLDDRLFRSVKSGIADTRQLEGLAPELRKFLEGFETVTLIKGSQASVTRSTMVPSALRLGFVRIGSVAPGTDVEGEISVRPGEETVYELYAGEEPDPTFGTYRSIYHWVLAMAEEKE